MVVFFYYLLTFKNDLCGRGTIIATALGVFNLVVVFHWNRAWGIPDGFFCLGESAITSVVLLNSTKLLNY
ncbi:MAG: hypothetical protein ACK56F_26665 [bacterium]